LWCDTKRLDRLTNDQYDCRHNDAYGRSMPLWWHSSDHDNSQPGLSLHKWYINGDWQSDFCHDSNGQSRLYSSGRLRIDSEWFDRNPNGQHDSRHNDAYGRPMSLWWHSGNLDRCVTDLSLHKWYINGDWQSNFCHDSNGQSRLYGGGGLRIDSERFHRNPNCQHDAWNDDACGRPMSLWWHSGNLDRCVTDLPLHKW